MALKQSAGAGGDAAESSFGLRSRVIFGSVLAVLLLGVCGGWAATAKIAGAIIAPGSVRVDEHVKEVQHRDGGIISEIAVREGDLVQEGQVLLRLDDAQTRAELAIIKAQLSEQIGRQIRLAAERDGLTELTFPKAFYQTGSDAEAIARGETTLFVGNLLNRTRQKEQLQLQVSQLGQEIAGLKSQLEAIVSEAALVQGQHVTIAGLVEKKLMEASKEYAIKREYTQMQGKRGELEASIARAEGRVSEINLQMLAVDEKARNDAQRELRLLEATIAELTERQIAVEDRLSRTDIRSPIAGTVNELNVTTLGGVITPAQTIVTIVPEDAQLKVEARLSTIDIDQISVGRPARLRFSSFNSRTTPEVEGRVTYVSAASQVDPATGEVFYLGDIEIVGDLNAFGERQLVPGMPVEVFVQTNELTAISYLAKPFTDQFQRAFREE